MVTVETNSEQLQTPEIPPKREGRCRRPSSVVTSADVSDQSRWSFPVSQYRQSAIIEMGQAYPLEISHLNDPHEVRIPHYNMNNRNSIGSISSTLPLPLKEPLPYKESAPYMESSSPYRESSPYKAPLPYKESSPYKEPSYQDLLQYQRPSSYKEPSPYQEPSPYGEPSRYRDPSSYNESSVYKEQSPYRDPSSYRELSSYREASPYRETLATAQFTKPTSSSAHGSAPPSIPAKSQSYKNLPSTSFSDAYASAQESIEDLNEPYVLSSVPPLSDLRANDQTKTSPNRSLGVSGHSNHSTSSLYENELSQKEELEENRTDNRRSQTLKKLQQIITDDDIGDASYITASDTPKRRSAFRHPSGQHSRSLNDDLLMASTSGLRISNPDSANTSFTKTANPQQDPMGSAQKERYDRTSPQLVHQGDSAIFLDSKSGSYPHPGPFPQEVHSSPSSTVPPGSVATATSTAIKNKPRSSRRKHSSGSKRNFTKKSLEDMMHNNPSPYDIGDIGLPKPERVLLEKFIDSLSKLSIEVQMDEGKREEGRRRLNNALRALEGWF